MTAVSGASSTRMVLRSSSKRLKVEKEAPPPKKGEPSKSRLMNLPRDLLDKALSFLSPSDFAGTLPVCYDFRQSAKRVFELILRQPRTITYRGFLPYDKFTRESIGTPWREVSHLLGKMSNLTCFESLKQGDYQLQYVDRILTERPASLTELRLSDDFWQAPNQGDDDYRYTYVGGALLMSLAQKCSGITTFSFDGCYSLDDEQMGYLLSQMRKLKRVSLRDNWSDVVEKNAMKALAQTPSLTSVDLHKCWGISAQDVTHLVKSLPKLTFLDISISMGKYVEVRADGVHIEGAALLLEAITRHGTQLTTLKMDDRLCKSHDLDVIKKSCTKLQCVEVVTPRFRRQ
ncbi:MAG: hypothetical protein HYX48_06995 [Chlamydiales bacterium]|nr:hypothetical protein [Chlamydiales bacterium]